ncbi:MAG: hypothetical protein ABEI58_01125 [Candidatus Nanohaloarchaea archaeon]
MPVKVPYDEVRADTGYVKKFMDAIDAEEYGAGTLNYETPVGDEVMVTETDDGIGIIGHEELVDATEAILRSRVPWLKYRMAARSYENRRALEEFGELF